MQPVGLGRPLHLEAVLVGAGEEEGVVAEQPVPPGQGVGGDRRVGVADVGHVVDVVDRRRHVEAGHGGNTTEAGGRLPRTAVRRPTIRRRWRIGDRLGHRLEPAAGAEVVDLVDRALQGLAPGAGQVVVGPLGALEPTGHHDRPARRTSAHCGAEPAEALQDLVADLLEPERVDRLADHGQHGEQGERRAQHDLRGRGRRRSGRDRARA